MTSVFRPSVHHPRPITADERAEFSALLARLAIGFVHLAPHDVDAALGRALADVGAVVGGDRASLWRITPGHRQLEVSQEWRAPGIDPLPAERRTVPLEAVHEPGPAHRWFAGDGSQHVVLVPLRVADRLIGAARFEGLDGHAGWPEGIEELLAPFGELCASAIAAQRAIAGLEASELRYRSVLDEVGDVIVRIGPDGTLSYVNKAWYELTGNPVANTVGADPLANVHPDDRALAMEHMAAAMAGTPGVREVRFLAQGGDVRWMEVKGRAVFDAEGDLAGFSGVLHDVSERKAAEAHVQAAREAAEQARDEAEHARDIAERASRAKSEFLSRMSHELRTPLNAILGFTQLLEYAELQGEDAENLTMIARAGRHLLALINDALDVSRIESGRLSMSMEPVTLDDTARESLELVRADAARRRVALRTRGDAAGRPVVADRQRLKQVLVNLLSNAVKYNRDGGEVRIAWAELTTEAPPRLPAPHGWLRIEVSDTGRGIPADRLDDVFLPFERIGAERSEVDGSGIGLALTRSLVEAMGGRIGVRSVFGVGSTFYVDLPMAAPPAGLPDEPPAPPADESGSGTTHTIVYVEDNSSNVMLMRRILGRRPHARLLVAPDGDTGLDLIVEQRPDLVLLDLHLPGRSGEEVLAALRLDPVLRDTPVIIVTADLAPGTERRLTQAGATAFVSKPVDIGRLLDLVDDHIPALPSDPSRPRR
ncbi:ATP-binding protein [Dactylosporangium sp. CA-092794]|uniref:hybrid sensor histidine kinase/response regulator n=1 Tax=Dactylosporangium sp. CA-092794 TaxID=3239929 RepID=UPI003D8A2760